MDVLLFVVEALFAKVEYGVPPISPHMANFMSKDIVIQYATLGWFYYHIFIKLLIWQVLK